MFCYNVINFFFNGKSIEVSLLRFSSLLALPRKYFFFPKEVGKRAAEEWQLWQTNGRTRMSNLIRADHWRNQRDRADTVLWRKDNDEGQARQLDRCPALPLYQAQRSSQTACTECDL